MPRFERHATTGYPIPPIDEGTKLDANIGVGCLLGPNVRLGARSVLHPYAVVVRDTCLGEDNIVHPFAVLGGDPHDLKYAGEPTELWIGDRNVIREHASIHRGTGAGGGCTKLGNENLVMAHCHVGHDVSIGSGCIIGSGTSLGGHVVVQDFARLGGNVSIAQRVRIGTHAFVGGHSGIDRDVPPFCVAYGNRPRKIRGANLAALRRTLDRATLMLVRAVVAVWTDSRLSKGEAIARIREEHGAAPAAIEFLKFVESAQRGVLR